MTSQNCSGKPKWAAAAARWWKPMARRSPPARAKASSGICLDPKTGAVLWKHQISAVENHHNINGPVASRRGRRARVFPPGRIPKQRHCLPACPVICLKTDGTELWRESEQYWGTEGSTPLVVGDTLYVCSAGTNHLMVAVDKVTGKLRWGTQLHPDPSTVNKKVIYGAPASVTYQEVAGIRR